MLAVAHQVLVVRGSLWDAQKLRLSLSVWVQANTVDCPAADDLRLVLAVFGVLVSEVSWNYVHSSVDRLLQDRYQLDMPRRCCY